MSCIACDSASEFRCTIKSLSVCVCSKHLDKKGHYDSVIHTAESN